MKTATTMTTTIHQYRESLLKSRCELTPNAITVYRALYFYMGIPNVSEKMDELGNVYCDVFIADIMKHAEYNNAKVSKSTVQRSIKLLEEKNILYVVKANTKGKPNRYYLDMEIIRSSSPKGWNVPYLPF
jgi:hypothetical protein